MPEVRFDDERLPIVLASVGEHLVVDRAATALRPSESRPLWRPLLVAAVALAVVAGAVLVVAPARRVVGGWFGAGRIDVEIDRAADPAGLPSFTEPAERIDPADADEVLGKSMPPVDSSALGPPTDWWTLPEGGVLVGWHDGETSLWVTASGDDDLLKKVVSGSNDVTELTGLGDGGLAVSGTHLMQTPHRRVRADSVVIWTDGELTLRLDGTGELDDVVALARQLAGQ